MICRKSRSTGKPPRDVKIKKKLFIDMIKQTNHEIYLTKIQN